MVTTEAALRRALWAGQARPLDSEREGLLRALRPHHDGCWTWPGRVRKGRGRASISVAGRRIEIDVHRALYALLVGPIPPGHMVSQRCGRTRCARPEHLEVISAR